MTLTAAERTSDPTRRRDVLALSIGLVAVAVTACVVLFDDPGVDAFRGNDVGKAIATIAFIVVLAATALGCTRRDTWVRTAWVAGAAGLVVDLVLLAGYRLAGSVDWIQYLLGPSTRPRRGPVLDSRPPAPFPNDLVRVLACSLALAVVWVALAAITRHPAFRVLVAVDLLVVPPLAWASLEPSQSFVAPLLLGAAGLMAVEAGLWKVRR